MVNPNPNPGPAPVPVESVKDDPTKPIKAIIAALVAGGGVALAEGTDILPPWALLLIAVIVGGLATYGVSNPKTLR